MRVTFFSRKHQFLVLTIILFTVSLANAATRTSTATGGTWATGSTWVGGVAPVAGDDVIIATTGANSVSLGANASITNVTVNAGATLNILTRTLTISGFFTNNGSVSVTTGQVNPAGNFTNTGNFTLSTGRITVISGNFNNTGTLTYSGAGRLYLGRNYINSGTVTLLSAAVYFTGTANQSIQGFTTTGTVNMNKTGGTATFTTNVSGAALTLNGIGGTLDLGTGLTHTFSSTLTRTNGTLNCSSSLLRLGASVSGTVATINAGSGTIEYYRAGNQTAAVLTYNNLILSGTLTKTFATTPTVNGELTLSGTAIVTVTTGVVTYGPNATLRYNKAGNYTATSEEWVTPFAATGGVIIDNIGIITLNTAKVFGVSSPLTITSTGRLATNNFGLTYGGNFVINTGGTFTAGTAPIVITNTMATQSIAGFTTSGLISMTKTAGTATFTSNVNGGALSISGTGGTLNLGTGLTHTLTGAVTLSNGILNGGSSILNANSTSTVWTGTGANFVAGTGTVNFGGTAQTLATASTFNNLIFSGSGLKTLTGVPTINGILSMEGTATVSAASTYGAAATLQYNRTVAQTAGPEWVTPFSASGGVSVINTGVITANGIKSFSASAPLNIAAGASLNNGGFAITGSSSLTVANTGTLLLSGTSVFPVFTATTLGTNSTVNYNGAAQTVAIVSYGNLVLSGSGTKTFVGTTTIAGSFSISGTAVALLLNGTASSSASLILGGILQTTPGSYGGAASVATNTNATWFGTTTTGVLNVTSTCLAGTWLGTTNTDWNTTTNWCGGTIPTALTNVTISATPNQPVIGVSGGICNNLTIANGATLTISGSNTLVVSGNWTNNGTFTPNASTVNFNGTVAQFIGGTAAITFNNLTNSNTTAAVTATKDIAVTSILNIANNAVLDMTTFALTGVTTNTGTGQLITANTTALPIPSGKTWTNTILYAKATGGQTIVAGTYNGSPSLEIDNTSGTQTASGTIVTGGQLNINNGGTPTFDLGGFNLTTNALNITAPNSVLDMRAGTLTINTLNAMDGKVRFSGTTNAIAFASGTVEYYGAAQTVANGNYYNLLFSGVSGVYSIVSDIDIANTLNVTNGAVTVKNGFTLTVDDAVTVTSPGTLTFENNASLLQTSYTGANFGDVKFIRNTTPVLQYDATYWSSPTTGTQTLFDFSPLTDYNRFNGYDSVNDVYTFYDAPTTVFSKGLGYIIRCPSITSAITPAVISHQFVGTPNNGSFTIPLTTPPGDIGLSLIGNPYPSAINADDFINENLYDAVLNPTNTLTGTYYFWSHNTRLVGNDFSSDDYYTCNLSGPTGFTNSGTGNNTPPTGYIASGQGFFVENQIAGNLKFNNSMRETKNNTNFYRTKKTKRNEDLERHRIWLDLTNSAKTTGSQTLVGYIENATNGYDLGYDSYLFDDTRPLLIYSMLGVDTMAIQGRTLPFTESDVVPIGYFTKEADNVTLSINRVDGLFNEDQNIYLEDKLLNVIHDMKADSYTFASAAGTFNNRFVLRYTDTSLATKNFDEQSNKVLVSVKNKQIIINSITESIDKVMVYDILGKQIYKKENANSQEVTLSNMTSKNQALIVKTTLQNGELVTNKIIF